MTTIFKSVFAVLTLMMLFTSVDGQKIVKLKIDSNGNLSLDPPGPVELGNVFARRISWRIDDPRIVSFQIAPKSTTEENPFNEPYDKPHGKNLDLQVKFLHGGLGSTEWQYSISCTDNSGKEYTLDPIIAIKPGNTILAVLIGLLIIIFTGRFFVKQRRSARNTHRT